MPLSENETYYTVYGYECIGDRCTHDTQRGTRCKKPVSEDVCRYDLCALHYKAFISHILFEERRMREGYSPNSYDGYEVPSMVKKMHPIYFGLKPCPKAAPKVVQVPGPLPWLPKKPMVPKIAPKVEPNPFFSKFWVPEVKPRLFPFGAPVPVTKPRVQVPEFTKYIISLSSPVPIPEPINYTPKFSTDFQNDNGLRMFEANGCKRRRLR